LNRRSPTVLLGCAVFYFWTAASPAQVDTEPANGAQETADPLLPAGPAFAATVNVARLDAGGNDVDFFTAAADTGQVLLGMVAPIGALPDEFDTPDTMLATFTSADTPVTFNDDSYADTNAPSGPTFGSLFRLIAETDSYRIGVTGYADEDFDGFMDAEDNSAPHEQSGRYVITVGRVDPAGTGGHFADTDPANDATSGADILSVAAGTGAVGVAELGAPGDIDYFRLTLKAGDILSAMTAPLEVLPESFRAPDTILGLFDSGGAQMFHNDDAGGFDEAEVDPALSAIASDFPFFITENDHNIFGSALHAEIPFDGTYYLGATGFGDEAFAGNHTEAGRYALLVSVVPAPSLGGDYNGSGLVEQADLDLVLSSWGQDGSVNVPPTWTNDLPAGLIDQGELDRVLSNWGGSAAGRTTAAAVPEPATAMALLTALTAIGVVRMSRF
jgi:hypothetical protein